MSRELASGSKMMLLGQQGAHKNVVGSLSGLQNPASFYPEAHKLTEWPVSRTGACSQTIWSIVWS